MSVVFPASGWLMIAKVLRRWISVCKIVLKVRGYVGHQVAPVARDFRSAHLDGVWVDGGQPCLHGPCRSQAAVRFPWQGLISEKHEGFMSPIEIEIGVEIDGGRVPVSV